jgi:Sulfotransferase domain
MEFRGDMLYGSSVLTGLKYVRGLAGLRESDVILAAFPKSGSTWLRFLFCNLGSLLEWRGSDVDFEILNKVMPSLASNLFGPPFFKRVPRIVITHRRYLPFYSRNRRIMMLRDPRDVMVSYFHYSRSLKVRSWKGTFSQFIRDSVRGLPAWCAHYRSWIDRVTLVVRYEALMADTVKEFERMAASMGVSAGESILLEAVARSSFRSIRAIEENKGLAGVELLRGFRFTRQGDVGKWYDLFSKEDLEYFHQQLRKNRIELPDYE